MPRRNGNAACRKRYNKGQHQRCRTTRGHRLMSKFKKYYWYGPPQEKKGPQEKAGV
jgi:hypothetical protein